MVVKFGTTAACLQWSKPNLPQPPSSSQALASAISSPSLPRRCRSEGALIIKSVQNLNLSAMFDLNLTSTNIKRSRSSKLLHKSRSKTLRRACSASASLHAFSDEEFSKKIQELALNFQFSNNDDTTTSGKSIGDELDSENEKESVSIFGYEKESFEFNEGSSSIERKGNSVDLLISLRMIKRKLQWQERFQDAGESAMKKAFSSMVFIIWELQSYT